MIFAALAAETSGLGGMRERVARLGGRVEFEAAGAGVVVITAEMPLQGDASFVDAR